MTYFIESLGCAKNLVDTERFVSILQTYGFLEVESPERADLVLVNTCSFLAASFAELELVLDDVFEELNPRKKTKVVVTGCVMNRGLELFQEMFPRVNKWIPLKDFDAFEKYILRYVLPKGVKPRPVNMMQRAQLEDGQHVYLRIADGCENNCSYCMIPSIRGKLISEPIEKLVEEATLLSPRGRELVLIAQDSCLYGTDLYGEKALPKLIEALHAIPGYDWIRIMYMHPDHFELQWTELWKKYPKLLPYFEIPIQHASDRIIHLMNRQKGYNELKALFDHIRKEIPAAVFRTTLMVAYPTETKQDLDQIDSFLQEVDVLYAGVFGYSPEKEGTAYGEREGFDWDAVEKLETEYGMKTESAREEKMQRFVGTVQQVLLEGYDEDMKSYYGRLWFQAPEIDGIAYVDGLPPDSPILVDVEVVDALADELSCIAITAKNDRRNIK